jgi:DNA-binding transcriptional MerR regulator
MTLSTNEVAIAAQVSLRQLQWWDERRVVMPGQVGHKRLYDAEGLFKTLLVARMRKKQVSLQRIRKALASLPIAKLMAETEACLLMKRKAMQICMKDQIVRWMDLEDGQVSVICIAPLIYILNREIRKRRAH